MELGFLGTGTIAAAVVTVIGNDGHTITVSDRNARHAAALADTFDAVSIASNQDVVDRSDIIFLGLQARHARDVLVKLRFRAGQQIVSFIADMVAPATAAAIMLPFPAIAKGASPILAVGQTTVIHAIFSPQHTVFDLQSEAELNVYLCAQAVLSPILFMVANTADWMAQQGVDRSTGEPFLRALIASNLTGADAEETMNALATPDGYNLRLRDTLKQAGLKSNLRAGLDKLKL